MCNSLKKCKRSFLEAWLHDDRYKPWIRKVPSNDSIFHCIICNKNFSCNTSISRHADSAYHKNQIKENTSSLLNNVPLEKNISNTYKFQEEWLEDVYFRPWLRKVSHDKGLCFCSFCEIYITAKMSCIHRHAESDTHATNSKKINVEAKNTDEDVNMIDESMLSFDKKKKQRKFDMLRSSRRKIFHIKLQQIF